MCFVNYTIIALADSAFKYLCRCKRLITSKQGSSNIHATTVGLAQAVPYPADTRPECDLALKALDTAGTGT